MSRKIIHIDMDAFFASVEQRDNPEWKGKPIAVGGGGDRGVVAAASYEARKFGVRSAMASIVAKRKCPHLIFAPPRFDVYRTTSLVIRSIFKQYTSLIEPLSLDEAYLDVTENKKGNPSATLIAEEIRAKIFEQTGLTASAGVSFNKFLAKIASDQNKPNGVFVVEPEEAIHFIEQLPIDRFFGIGKVTAERLRKMGVFKGKDLKKISLVGLTQRFGKSGSHYYNICRAIDNREVVPFREPKSIGAESTFSADTDNKETLKEKLMPLIKRIDDRLKKKRKEIRTITLKLKYSDFETVSRSKSLVQTTNDKEIITDVLFQLLEEEELKTTVRLIGASVSNFDKAVEDSQLSFLY